jgi:hypothetical protein
MEKKVVTVDIEDLRDFVGGSADVAGPEGGELGPATNSAYTGTAMCYRFAISPDAGEAWTKVSGK